MAHILIIEDDPDLGARLADNLKLEGYRVTLAADGRTGLDQARLGFADLILLDLMLPHLDGLHILKALRRDLCQVPVIILTAKGTEAQRIEGFRSGGDDYVVKPFSLMELIARVRAVLRRTGFRERPSVINSGGLMMDPAERTATLDGRSLALAPREFDLLYALAAHPNQALSRTALLEDAWGDDADVSGRTVDNHVASLRRKIEENPETPTRIITVYKVGYRWKTS
ncbi:MAG: response regulator transcription factor [bacterium]|nr:response regulator transcription factor [bacterium]